MTAQARQRSHRGPSRTAEGVQALGYVRVSTQEQGDSGAGLEAQRSAIRTACRDRDFELVDVFEDVASAKDLNRPELTACLALLDSGRANALVVAKLDRLSRSLLDFATVMARSQTKGWSVVALDLGVDTSTPAGEMMASVLATFAQFERRLIGQRTKDALAVKKAEGVKLGRPRGLTASVVDRILSERAGGASMAAIARSLNADSVPTSQGGAQWYASTVRAVLTYAESTSTTADDPHPPPI